MQSESRCLKKGGSVNGVWNVLLYSDIPGSTDYKCFISVVKFSAKYFALECLSTRFTNVSRHKIELFLNGVWCMSVLHTHIGHKTITATQLMFIFVRYLIASL